MSTSGHVKPASASFIVANLDGKLSEVSEEGKTVKAGDPLAVIDCEELIQSARDSEIELKKKNEERRLQFATACGPWVSTPIPSEHLQAWARGPETSLGAVLETATRFSDLPEGPGNTRSSDGGRIAAHRQGGLLRGVRVLVSWRAFRQ